MDQNLPYKLPLNRAKRAKRVQTRCYDVRTSDDVNYRSESIDAENDMILDDLIARVETLSRIVCAIRLTNMEIMKYLWDCSWKEREVGL